MTRDVTFNAAVSSTSTISNSKQSSGLRGIEGFCNCLLGNSGGAMGIAFVLLSGLCKALGGNGGGFGYEVS